MNGKCANKIVIGTKSATLVGDIAAASNEQAAAIAQVSQGVEQISGYPKQLGYVGRKRRGQRELSGQARSTEGDVNKLN